MKAITKSRVRLVTLVAAAAAIVAATAAVLPADNASARLAVGTTLEAAQPAVPAVAYSDGALDLGAAAKQPTPVAAPQPATAAAPKRTASAPAAKPKTVSTKPAATSTDELAEARRILAGLIAKYPILKGTTVSFGDTKGYQAICYYRSGRIVINPNHTVSLSRILNHEVWHVIDWRDNGRIDWGENVPPR